MFVFLDVLFAENENNGGSGSSETDSTGGEESTNDSSNGAGAENTNTQQRQSSKKPADRFVKGYTKRDSDLIQELRDTYNFTDEDFVFKADGKVDLLATMAKSKSGDTENENPETTKERAARLKAEREAESAKIELALSDVLPPPDKVHNRARVRREFLAEHKITMNKKTGALNIRKANGDPIHDDDGNQKDIKAVFNEWLYENQDLLTIDGRKEQRPNTNGARDLTGGSGGADMSEMDRLILQKLGRTT